MAEKTRGTILRITEKALESALQGAREVFPREFIAFFRGTEEENGSVTLNELVLAPLSEYGDGYSALSPFHDWIAPHNLGALASFHSHPHPPARPSRADLSFFSRTAHYHFIACPPFTFGSVKAFDGKGNEEKFVLV